MSENYESMLYQEVLARLKTLEKENERLREHLRATNTLLVELQGDLGAAKKDATLHIKKIYAHMTDFSDHLWPVFYKVFPHVAVEQKKIREFLTEASQAPKK